jgi:hypothetical protein
MSPDKMIEFYNFQRHKRSILPKVLQRGTLMSSVAQQTETQSSEEVGSNGQEIWGSLEKTKVWTQKEDIPSKNVSGDQDKDQTETMTKEGEEGPMFTPDKSTTNAVGKQISTEIANPV